MPNINYQKLKNGSQFVKINDPESCTTSYEEQATQITYSWNKINVHTEARSRRNAFGRIRQCFGLAKKASAERHILKDVSGICRPGELLAILGASGAGKTTLLNVLTSKNSRNIRITGELYVNGRRVDPDNLTSKSAYVQQDDLFIGTLTVREQLIFQAMLRMDRYYTTAERMSRVEEVLLELGLQKCRNTLIGVPGRVKGISGGETKRLAFACEVLTNPVLLFCDEPTSGLDSFMAQNVVAVMKNMAEKGKTIISTIHQPSSEVFAMFDRLLLMAEGRVAFVGDADAAYDFFSRIGLNCPSNYNPADFYIMTLAIQPGKEAVCRKAVNSVCDQFRDSDDGDVILAAVEGNQKPNGAKESSGSFSDSYFEYTAKSSRYKANWMSQFKTVLWRSWLEIAREPLVIRVRFFQVVLISIVLGIIYMNQELTQAGITNINGFLFLFLTNMTFQNVFAVINTFCNQIPVFLREHFNGMYRTDVYFLCKTIAELPFTIVNPVVFVSIAYLMVGLEREFTSYATCVLIVTLVANIANSFGYLISCMAKNLSMALVLATPLIIPLMLFGGFFLNQGSVPPYLSWMQYISWFRYSNEALNINQWSLVGDIPCTVNKTCFPDGQSVLTFYHYDDGSILLDIIFLIILLFAYRFLAFCFLLSKTYRK